MYLCVVCMWDGIGGGGGGSSKKLLCSVAANSVCVLWLVCLSHGQVELQTALGEMQNNAFLLVKELLPMILFLYATMKNINSFSPFTFFVCMCVHACLHAHARIFVCVRCVF